jgi:hypothetical protein
VKRVEVDFGTTVRGGMIRASQHRAGPDTLEIGDRVEAFDPDEGMSFTGIVEDADDRFAYLRMEWRSVPTNEPGRNYSLTFNGQMITGATFSERGEGGTITSPTAPTPMQPFGRGSTVPA